MASGSYLISSAHFDSISLGILRCGSVFLLKFFRIIIDDDFAASVLVTACCIVLLMSSVHMKLAVWKWRMFLIM